MAGVQDVPVLESVRKMKHPNLTLHIPVGNHLVESKFSTPLKAKHKSSFPGYTFLSLSYKSR